MSIGNIQKIQQSVIETPQYDAVSRTASAEQGIYRLGAETAPMGYTSNPNQMAKQFDAGNYTASIKVVNGWVEGTTKGTQTFVGEFKINPSELSKIDMAKFKAAIIVNQYSTKPTGPFRVPLLSKAKWLGHQDGRRLLYQQSGAAGPVAARGWVIGLQAHENSNSTYMKIDWKLLDKGVESYASQIGIDPNSVIETPVNEGSWELDLNQGVIRYTLTTDSGGNLPGWATSFDLALKYPSYVVNDVFGLSGSFNQVK